MRLIATLCVLSLAVPAFAQDTPADWDLHRDARQRQVMAYTVFDAGVGISARCTDGNYEAVVLGLPEAPGDAATRVIGVAFGDADIAMERWNVAINRTVAHSEVPAPFARKLRRGGRLQLVVPDGAGPGRNIRYDLTLPASATAIDETLTTCERPLVDPRDAELADLPEGGLPMGLTWARAPRAEFPNTRYARGFALITCVTAPDGGLRDCMIESQHPGDGGFGESALRAARRGRVTLGEGVEGPIPVAKVQFRANFIVPGYERPGDRPRRTTR